MKRKIFKTGNDLAVSLPQELLQQLELTEGSSLSVSFNPARQQIILEPANASTLDSIDAEFSQQLDRFIEQYRSALNALAK